MSSHPTEIILTFKFAVICCILAFVYQYFCCYVKSDDLGLGHKEQHDKFLAHNPQRFVLSAVCWRCITNTIQVSACYIYCRQESIWKQLTWSGGGWREEEKSFPCWKINYFKRILLLMFLIDCILVLLWATLSPCEEGSCVCIIIAYSRWTFVLYFLWEKGSDKISSKEKHLKNLKIY